MVIVHGFLMRIFMNQFTGKSLVETYDMEFDYGCRLVFETNLDDFKFRKFIPGGA